MFAAMNDLCNSDVGMLNTGGVRSSSFRSGDVKFSDVFEWFPFDNNVVYVKMTGKKLKEYVSSKSSMIFNSEYDEKDFDDDTVYIFATSDYCANYSNQAILLYTTDGKLYNTEQLMYQVLVNYLKKQSGGDN